MILMLPAFPPPIIQRFLMSRDTQQMKSFMNISGILGIVFVFCIGMIGLTVLCMAPETPSSKVFPYFINQLLPSGLRGLAISGMLAVIMSTADSFLNTGSISLVHDVIHTLKKGGLNDKIQLKLTRYVTVLMGIGAILASFTSANIMSIVLTFGNFWGGIAWGPMILTLWGFQGTPQGFLAGALAGLVTIVGWMLSKSTFGFGGFLPSILVNVAVFTLVSLYTRKKNLCAHA